MGTSTKLISARLHLQKNLSAKSTTQVVRTMYMSMVAAGVRACGASPAQADVLQPVLSKAVDKAAQQPLQVLTHVLLWYWAQTNIWIT